MTRNCTDEFPFSEILYEELRTDVPILILTGVASLFTVLTLLLFGEEVVFLIRHYQCIEKRQKIIIILALYPVISFTSLLCLLVPTSTLLGEFVASIYLSYCVFLFVHLTISYFGGQSKVLDQYSERTISFRTPPCCCCCFCLSKVALTRKTITIIKLLVLQVAILRPILLFIAAVLWSDGKYRIGGQTDFSTSEAYLSILNGISNILAMYGMIITYRAANEKLKHYRLRLKFTCLQLTVIIVNLQNIICSVLGQNGIPSCEQSRGSVVRASRTNHFLLTLEMFLLALLARIAYRRREDDYNPNEGQSEDSTVSYGAINGVPSSTSETETKSSVVSLNSETQPTASERSGSKQQACQTAHLGIDNYVMMDVNDEIVDADIKKSK